MSATNPERWGEPLPPRNDRANKAGLAAAIAALGERGEPQDVLHDERPSSTQQRGTAPEGFVVSFDVDVLFDPSVAGPAFDLVEVRARCWVCGEASHKSPAPASLAELGEALAEHARSHEPAR